MRLTIIMAAVKKGTSGVLERVPSAGPTRNKLKGTPVRGLHPNSSPVYKTTSESTLTSGLKNLSINDDKNITKRNSSSRSNNSNVRTLADVANLLQSDAVKNVVMVAGAGISTPSGIPDFRSPGTGLYDNLQQYQIPYPEAIFDIDYFHVNPRPFFTLAKELYPSGKYRPNYIHYFARLLYDKGVLLRMYTQNIDGLERLAGLPAEKLVEAHGTFATATCTVCRQKMPGSDIKEKIFSDKLPRCPTRGCIGIVKPDIVFFGEDLPRKFYSYMKDMLQTDLVIVLGTSLEVQPFAGIIDTVRWAVPRVLFNREAVGPFKYNRRSQDVVAAGDLVDNMVKFSSMVGWKADMVDLITKQEGEFKIINVPPPVQRKPNPNQRNYSSLAYQRRNVRYSDSSSEESTDSESDDSSDSSEEEVNRIKKFRGFTRGKYGNNSVRNGANASNTGIRNGFRSSSAKLGDTNVRKIHTDTRGGRTLNGSLTGRSVKSESGLNENAAKRRLDQKQQNKGQESNLGNKNVSVAEKNRVLRKYGLSPSPNVIPEASSILEEMQKPVQTFLKNNKNGGKEKKGKQALSKKRTEETEVTSNNVNGVNAIKNDLSPSDKVVESQSEQNGVVEAKETEEVQNGYEEQDKNLLKLEETYTDPGKPPLRAEPVKVEFGIRREPPITCLKREHSVASGYFIEDAQHDLSREQNDNAGDTGTIEIASNINSSGPVVNQIGYEEEKHTTDDKTYPLTENGTVYNEVSEETGVGNGVVEYMDSWKPCDTASIASDSNSNGNPKQLSTKTAESFAKFAHIQSQRRVIGRAGGKPRRKPIKDKPPTGKNTSQLTDLSKLNARPYGYAYRQKIPIRGIGPFHRIDVRTLNSSIDFTQELRSGSAELPKISYRHNMEPQPVNVYDGRVHGFKVQGESGGDFESR